MTGSRPIEGERPAAAIGRVRRDGVIAVGRELSLVLAAALVYFGVRAITEGRVASAVAHAHRLFDLERTIGLDLEQDVQSAALGHPWAVTFANWVYIWGHWPVITITLVWLFQRDLSHYRLLRNAMFVSGAIGLVVFASWPVAPPRLAGLGFLDTVTQQSHFYRALQPPAIEDEYASLPSLHVGWNFLVGLFVWRLAENPVIRWVAAVSPALMFAAVVATANHFVIDGITGIAVAGLGLLVARW